jgi:GntR family transcriptional regulator/MocR family aminotransferase
MITRNRRPDSVETAKSKRLKASVAAAVFAVGGKTAVTHRVLAEHIRARILSGGLPRGTRLPTIRALAKELGLDRNVVQKAFQELRLQGLVSGKQRGGTSVCFDSIKRRRRAPQPSPTARWCPQPAEYSPGTSSDFAWDLRPGQVLVHNLRLDVWRRACREAGRHLPPSSYGDPTGERNLREALASYLGRTRALSIGAENIVVTSGSSAAISLIARAILPVGEQVAVEEPGYRPAVEDFRQLGAKIVTIPVDIVTGHGIEAVLDASTAPLIVHLTPAHQYPLGVRLSQQKRDAIISWARRNGSLIIENDYDHEFSHAGEQLPPLASVAPDCVALVGTFSKSLSPSMRIGFIVAPALLIQRVRALMLRSREQVAWPLQQILLWLLRSHAIDRNIARNKKHFALSRNAILAAFLPFKEHIQVFGHEGGLHVVLRFSGSLSVDALDRTLKRAGVCLGHVGEMETTGSCSNALLLGYGHLREADLEVALEKITSAIRQTIKEPSKN